MATEILKGVVGSQAYGLAHADSDTDTLAIHVASPKEILGLSVKSAVSSTTHSTSPDFTSHELGKFCELALKANPTLMEILWLASHQVLTPSGQLLIDNREAFLSTITVKAAYGGYAFSQARKLERIHTGTHPTTQATPKSLSAAKRGRHAMRVTIQGHNLLTTGTLTVDVSEHRDTIYNAGEVAAQNPSAFVKLIESKLAEMDNAISVLPDTPNRGVVDEVVTTIRSEELREYINAPKSPTARTAKKINLT